MPTAEEVLQQIRQEQQAPQQPTATQTLDQIRQESVLSPIETGILAGGRTGLPGSEALRAVSALLGLESKTPETERLPEIGRLEGDPLSTLKVGS
jgi:hypothetical protein